MNMIITQGNWEAEEKTNMSDLKKLILSLAVFLS